MKGLVALAFAYSVQGLPVDKSIEELQVRKAWLEDQIEFFRGNQCSFKVDGSEIFINAPALRTSGALLFFDPAKPYQSRPMHTLNNFQQFLGIAGYDSSVLSKVIALNVRSDQSIEIRVANGTHNGLAWVSGFIEAKGQTWSSKAQDGSTVELVCTELAERYVAPVPADEVLVSLKEHISAIEQSISLFGDNQCELYVNGRTYPLVVDDIRRSGLVFTVDNKHGFKVWEKLPSSDEFNALAPNDDHALAFKFTIYPGELVANIYFKNYAAVADRNAIMSRQTASLVVDSANKILGTPRKWLVNSVEKLKFTCK